MAKKLKDVATIKTGASDKIGDGSLNASPAVILTISKQPDVNTIELTDRLDGAIADLNNTLPESVEIKSHIFRQANFIEASIDNLNQTLLEGAFFVVIVHLPDELAYHSHFTPSHPNFSFGFGNRTQNPWLYNQHHESRWNGHRHRSLG